jgi:YfiH family protein
MPISECGGLKSYTFDIFPRTGLVHGLYTRQGGVSPAPWSSLNLGGTVGDERANVVENRRRIFAAVDRPVESIFDVWQVHGTHAVASRIPRPLDGAHQQADIILTDQPAITLFMRFADCVPILLYEPRKRVVCVAHAGWKGTLARAAGAAVAAMIETYDCCADDILAGIGPSICRRCYEVGAEVVAAVRTAFNGSAGSIMEPRGERMHLDLWEANRIALVDAGVQARNIEVAGLCTAENTDLWYSHRAEKGRTGRFGALLALEE